MNLYKIKTGLRWYLLIRIKMIPAEKEIFNSFKLYMQCVGLIMSSHAASLPSFRPPHKTTLRKKIYKWIPVVTISFWQTLYKVLFKWHHWKFSTPLKCLQTHVCLSITLLWYSKLCIKDNSQRMEVLRDGIIGIHNWPCTHLLYLIVLCKIIRCEISCAVLLYHWKKKEENHRWFISQSCISTLPWAKSQNKSCLKEKITYLPEKKQAGVVNLQGMRIKSGSMEFLSLQGVWHQSIRELLNSDKNTKTRTNRPFILPFCYQ